jgi:hypothetical protein
VYISNFWEDAIAMTPSDTAALNDPKLPALGYFAGFVPGLTGTIKVRTANENVVVITVVAGYEYRIPIKQVFATGGTGSQTAVGLVRTFT